MNHRQLGPNSATPTRAQELFKTCPEEYRTLIRLALQEEREVMHLKRRSDIHQKLYEHVKREVK